MGYGSFGPQQYEPFATAQGLGAGGGWNPANQQHPYQQGQGYPVAQQYAYPQQQGYRYPQQQAYYPQQPRGYPISEPQTQPTQNFSQQSYDYPKPPGFLQQLGQSLGGWGQALGWLARNSSPLGAMGNFFSGMQGQGFPQYQQPVYVHGAPGSLQNQQYQYQHQPWDRGPTYQAGLQATYNQAPQPVTVPGIMNHPPGARGLSIGGGLYG